MTTEDAMPSYRTCLLNVNDKAALAQEFIAASDDAAMTVAYRLARESAVELWCGPRMVARVPVIGRFNRLTASQEVG
jgi:hypothetical protein